MFDFFRKKKDKPVYRKRGYAAAKTPRSSEWLPVGGDNVNDLIREASPKVRERVRNHVRNFPYFSRANNLIVNYTVNTGIMFQSKITDGEGNFNKKLNQQIEDSFNFWADECDISGKLHFYEMMRLAKRQEGEAGEFLIIKRRPNKSSYLPYKLQIIEPDWLYTDSIQPKNKAHKVDQGIKYDTRTGEILSFYIENPDYGKPQEISATRVIHGFETLRPGQLRGISPFTSGVLLANELSTLISSSIDTSLMASKYLMFITTPDAEGRQNAIDSGEEGQQDPRIEEVQNAIFEYLEPGENVEFATPPNIGSNLEALSKLILRMLSVATDIPYDLLTMDTGDFNYSKGKMVRIDFNNVLKVAHKRHIMQFCKPAIKPFYDCLALSGKVHMPGYSNNPAIWQKDFWQPPGIESIDPAKEIKAKIQAIQYGLSSEILEAKKAGFDFEELMRDQALASQIRKENGVDIMDFLTKSAGNKEAKGNKNK